MLKLLITFILLLNSTAFADAKSKSLTIGTGSEYDTLNPLLIQSQMSFYIYLLVGRPLAKLDPTGKWVAQLAERLPSLKNGDAKIITVNGKKILQARWKIQEKAKWSDGTPVTCADFKLAREIADSPNVSVASKENYTIVEKVDWDPTKPKLCTFTYNKLRWDFANLNFLIPLPAHLEGPIFEKHKNQKEGYEKNSLYNAKPITDGLYNGPYKIVEVVQGSHVVVETNPYFYGPKPKIEKIIIKIIPNTATLTANLFSGTIEAISPLGLSFDQALVLEKKVATEKKPFKVMFQTSVAYDHIDFKLDNPILKDVRVRQALFTATNREELTKVLFEGKQKVALHFLAPQDSWYTEKNEFIKKYPFNLRKAGQMLDEAGWTLNPADQYRYKDGKKLSFIFMATAGNQVREMIEAYLQAAWKKIGVEMIIKNEPARVLFGDTMPKRKFEAMIMYADSADGDLRAAFHSEQIPTEANGWSGHNVMGWKNAKVDELTTSMLTEFDVKKQAALAHNVVRIYTEEVPAIPLFYRVANSVIPEKLKNYRLSGVSDETSEAEKWEFAP